MLLFSFFACKAQSYTFNLVNQKLSLPQDTIRLTNPIATAQSTIMLKATPFKKIYHKSLGMFCHAENKMSKSAQLPIKMRLGTVQYVDKIEGK